MILIDSLYINNGGGKILLNYLVNMLEKNQINAYYLFDERCRKEFNNIPESRKFYLKASIFSRHQFYKINSNRFNKIFCFGNLAPSIALDVPVYTYFHQPMYLNIPNEFKLIDRFKFKLKTLLFSKWLKNTTKLLVQHQFMKKETINKFSLIDDKVLILPFYPNEDLDSESLIREKNTFIYVSNGTPHKNHRRLLEAFSKFYDQYKIGKLIVTVSDQFLELYMFIKELNDKGYPIINLGFVDRKELILNYHKSEYLIFPSLEESFGLGLVEAIDCGCKVIGSDLPYLYQVCEPSITFNPLSKESLFESFELAFNKQEKITHKKINNQIKDLLSLLMED